MAEEENHMSVKAGSILKANGGYLILNALDVLLEGIFSSMFIHRSACKHARLRLAVS